MVAAPTICRFPLLYCAFLSDGHSLPSFVPLVFFFFSLAIVLSVVLPCSLLPFLSVFRLFRRRRRLHCLFRCSFVSLWFSATIALFFIWPRPLLRRRVLLRRRTLHRRRALCRLFTRLPLSRVFLPPSPVSASCLASPTVKAAAQAAA